LNRKGEEKCFNKQVFKIGLCVDWLPRQNGFASKTINFCDLFLFIIIINFLDVYLETLKPCFFFLSSIDKVVFFFQTKMGLMMG